MLVSPTTRHQVAVRSGRPEKRTLQVRWPNSELPVKAVTREPINIR